MGFTVNWQTWPTVRLTDAQVKSGVDAIAAFLKEHGKTFRLEPFKRWPLAICVVDTLSGDQEMIKGEEVYSPESFDFGIWPAEEARALKAYRPRLYYWCEDGMGLPGFFGLKNRARAMPARCQTMRPSLCHEGIVRCLIVANKAMGYPLQIWDDDFWAYAAAPGMPDAVLLKGLDFQTVEGARFNLSCDGTDPRDNFVRWKSLGSSKAAAKFLWIARKEGAWVHEVDDALQSLLYEFGKHSGCRARADGCGK